MNDHILHNHDNDGIDRRGFLKCMAWAGTGVLWTISGGILTSNSSAPTAAAGRPGDFSFVQISDSHIGFNKPANTDVAGTLKRRLPRSMRLPNSARFHPSYRRPDASFRGRGVRHAGSDSENCKTTRSSMCPASTTCSTTTEEIIATASAKERKATAGSASITKGVHFIGLVNVMDIEEGGLGILGQEQFAWLKDDLARARPAARRSWCLPTCRFGPFTRNGAGARQDAEHALGC